MIMKARINLGKLLFNFIFVIIMFFLVFPIIITFIVSFNTSGFNLPVEGFTFKWFKTALSYKEFLSGMKVSLILGLIASSIAALMGVMVSIALSRYTFRGKDFINMFFMSPLLIPSAMIGLALYTFFVLLGKGEGIINIIIAHVVLVMPYSIRVILASFQNFDRSLEEAALNVGASYFQTFISITLPIVKTGIIAGMMMCFIISWNNFALTIFLAPPDWVPLPMRLYSYIKYEYNPSGAALVSCLIIVSGLLIYLLDRLVGLSAIMGIKSEGRN